MWKNAPPRPPILSHSFLRDEEKKRYDEPDSMGNARANVLRASHGADLIGDNDDREQVRDAL